MNINSLWYKKHLLSYLLWPFSLLYRMVVCVRNYLYRFGLKTTHYFSVPVIVVGNITVGGTGKTPLVVALADWFKQRGWRPGIVSRGYGGKSTKIPQPVYPDSDPCQVGDEAILLVTKTACPMIVGKDRVAATKTLLQDYACDLVISDDGLQHRALGRVAEIAVLDGERRLGNGFCLPAGPLRESKERLKTVDFLVTNGATQPGEWQMHLVPTTIYQLINPARHLKLEDLAGKTVHAVAGIGHPQRFFNTLRSLGIMVIEHIFADHYHFRGLQDIDFGADAFIIMTEKDAVKCRSFADKRHWCLSVTARLPDDFFRRLENILDNMMGT